MTMKDDQNSRGALLSGCTILGCFVVGIGGLIAAFWSAFEREDPTGAGACLIASAIAFGLSANAVFRK